MTYNVFSGTLNPTNFTSLHVEVFYSTVLWSVLAETCSICMLSVLYNAGVFCGPGGPPGAAGGSKSNPRKYFQMSC